MKIKVFLASLLLASTAAHAEFWMGNDLAKRLNGTDSEQLLAMGYIVGVADAGQSRYFCIPDNVIVRQIVDMSRNAMRKHAAVLHELTADVVVAYELKQAWPCQSRQNQSL